MNSAIVVPLLAFVLSLPPCIDAWLAKKIADAAKLALFVMTVGVVDAAFAAGLSQFAEGSSWHDALIVAGASVLSGLAVGIRRLTGGGDGSGGTGATTGATPPAPPPPAPPSPAPPDHDTISGGNWVARHDDHRGLHWSEWVPDRRARGGGLGGLAFLTAFVIGTSLSFLGCGAGAQQTAQKVEVGVLDGLHRFCTELAQQPSDPAWVALACVIEGDVATAVETAQGLDASSAAAVSTASPRPALVVIVQRSVWRDTAAKDAGGADE